MVRFDGHCLPCWVICVGSVAHIMGVIIQITFDFILTTILEILRINTMGAWRHIGYRMILLMYILIRLLVSKIPTAIKELFLVVQLPLPLHLLI